MAYLGSGGPGGIDVNPCGPLMHSQPLAAPRLPGIVVDLGGIAIGPGDGSPGGGVACFRGSRKYLELIKV